jgi:hypothetical protein
MPRKSSVGKKTIRYRPQNSHLKNSHDHTGEKKTLHPHTGEKKTLYDHREEKKKRKLCTITSEKASDGNATALHCI